MMDVKIVSRQKPVGCTDTKPTEWELELIATGNGCEIDWYKLTLAAIGRPDAGAEKRCECGVGQADTYCGACGGLIDRAPE